ncbi:WD40 repeat-like protein [Hesseltinella vesiculosa]|uniref:WD40 repeat-like protein n=1 Tax=Hesseltinella vesiculosa TaxID=101127 RepID=A0A1X2GD60_9FUNG|nr:WD40 repeat-like protein [Hesseltinella vesiculosa]
MAEAFPVNHGSVPIPPSQSSTLLPHQLTLATLQQNAPTTTIHSVQGPGLRRKQKESKATSAMLKLERILGLTTASSNLLASAESQDLIAYAAGAVIVLYNHKLNKQVGFLIRPSDNVSAANPPNASTVGTMVTPLGQPDTMLMMACALPKQDSKKKSTPASNRVKPISCLAFSPDGQYLAAGEMGHQPRILIWNVKDQALICQWRAHRFGILSVSFSPNMRYLVSVGFQHDGYLYVWNWRKGMKLATNKVTSKVNALSFANDSSYFVTAGLRHVKYWYLADQGRLAKKGNLASAEAQVLDGRSGLLGAMRECNFVDVACAPDGYVYLVTDSGILCLFKEGRCIDKWVDLQVTSAFSIQVSSSIVICATSNGIVRLFEPGTLKYRGMLPKPHPLGMDVTSIESPQMLLEQQSQELFYPDAAALTFDQSSAKLTVVYSDHSFYMWDIKHLDKIAKYRSFLAHSDCVWGVEPYPIIEDTPPSVLQSIPPNSFATYSADGTVRFWNLDPLDTSPPSPWRKNIYARDLVKMIYVDPDAAEYAKLKGDMELAEDQCPDFGIRSLKIKPDGSLMATGDRNGNLRVHDMTSWDQITFQEAHDSEILSIDISHPFGEDKPCYIATGSRDRFIHVFDAQKNYQLVQSLDDHSSSITSVRFTENAEKLISCGADKGIIFRHLSTTASPTLLDTTIANASTPPTALPLAYLNYHNHSGRSSVFDMTLDVSQRYAAAVTGERRLFLFHVSSGKPFMSCKPETAEEISSGQSTENSGGSLINIDLDPFSGTFGVTSGSDRSIRLFDLASGQCIEKVCAHAELITSVKFVVGRGGHSLRMVSTSSDGTVLVWAVSKDIVARMKSRAAESKHRLKQAVLLGQDTDPQWSSAPPAANPVTKRHPATAVATTNHSKPAVSFSPMHPSQQQVQQQQQQQRLRRVSTASVVVKPTLSQMIRQGERKTFSTMSPAEQKYDDLYKKPSARKPSDDTSAAGLVTASSPTSPHLNLGSAPPQRVSDMDKLQRLYNGLPTSGAVSSRTANHLQRSTPMQLGHRITPALKKKFSKDSLVGAGYMPPSKPRLRTSYDTLTISKRPPVSVDASPNSDPRLSSKKDLTPATSPTSARHPADLNQQPARVTSPTHTAIIVEEPEPLDQEGEEQVIFLQQPGDVDDHVGKPVDASSYDKAVQEHIGSTSTSSHTSLSSQTSSSTDDNHPKTPVLESEDGGDTEQEKHTHSKKKSRPGKSHEDDGSEADDTGDGSCGGEEEEEDDEVDEDEVLLQAILSRDPPRMMTSLSRSTSNAGAPHQRLSLDILSVTSPRSLDLPSTSAPSTPLRQSSATFWKLHRKLSNVKKRQSLTARFLSTFGPRDKKNHYRESLDSVLTSFKELGKKKDSSIKDEEQDEARIDVPIREVPEPPDVAPPTPPKVSTIESLDLDEQGLLADLDGAKILLDSVLETYKKLAERRQVTQSPNPAFLSQVESKLQAMHGSISNALTPVAPLPDPATLAMLDKYSSLLVQMVQTKLA